MKNQFTKLGDILTLAIPAATLLLTIFTAKNEIGKFLLAYALANFACYLIKGFTYANRPRTLLDQRIIWFNWSFKGGNSFPSGHATSAMAGAIYACMISPAIGALLTILAIFCAASRINARAHFMRDVFFGTIVAAVACGVIFWDIFNLF